MKNILVKLGIVSVGDSLIRDLVCVLIHNCDGMYSWSCLIGRDFITWLKIRAYAITFYRWLIKFWWAHVDWQMEPWSSTYFNYPWITSYIFYWCLKKSILVTKHINNTVMRHMVLTPVSLLYHRLRSTTCTISYKDRNLNDKPFFWFPFTQS